MSDTPPRSWPYATAGSVAMLGILLVARGYMGHNYSGVAQTIRWCYGVAGVILLLIAPFVAWRTYRQRRETSRAERQFEQCLCPTCDYPLRGNVSGVCPECGLRVGRHLFTVTGSFVLPGRGLVPLPPLSPADSRWVIPGQVVELRQPGGARLLTAVIALESLSSGNGSEPALLLPATLRSDDVLPGTQVWTVEGKGTPIGQQTS